MDAEVSRKQLRHRRLRSALEAEPLLTDADLSVRLGVSVQTVRLDRQALGIPQVRSRARSVAERRLRADSLEALDGQLCALEPGRSALAVFPGTGATSGPSGQPVLFARAEALALAAAGVQRGGIETVKVQFRTAALATGTEPAPVIGQGEVVRRPDGSRAVVVVTLNAGTERMLRAKFMVRNDGG